MATITQDRPRFYFIPEVATELRRSEASIRWLIHTDRIKTGRIGGRVVVSAEEIERLISEAFEESA